GDARRLGALYLVPACDGTVLEPDAHLDRGGIRNAGDRHAAGLRRNEEPEPVLTIRELDGRPGQQAHGLPLARTHRQTTRERLDPRQGGNRGVRRQRVELDATRRVRRRITEDRRNRDFARLRARLVEQARATALALVDEDRVRG